MIRSYLQRLLMMGGLVNKKPQKVEFGCGPNITEGFVGCDIRWFPGVVFVCDAWEICSFIEPCTVEEIYSRHFLEHLTFSQAELTIDCWARLLKPQGILRLCIPDLDYHIAQFSSPCWDSPSDANADWTTHQHAVAGLWGWQREGLTKMWDVHKSGYNLRMLNQLLRNKGFDSIERIPDKPWNLHIKAVLL